MDNELIDINTNEKVYEDTEEKMQIQKLKDIEQMDILCSIDNK